MLECPVHANGAFSWLHTAVNRLPIVEERTFLQPFPLIFASHVASNLSRLFTSRGSGGREPESISKQYSGQSISSNAKKAVRRA